MMANKSQPSEKIDEMVHYYKSQQFVVNNNKCLY